MKNNILLLSLLSLVLISCGKGDDLSSGELSNNTDSEGEIIYPSEDEILSVPEPSIPSAEGLVKISDVKLIPEDVTLTTGGVSATIYNDPSGKSITIQDNNEALLLYGVSTAILGSYKIGDAIEVTGTTANYNGLPQLVKITEIIDATASYSPVTTWDITTEWSETSLVSHAARLVTLKEVSVAGNSVTSLDPGTNEKGETMEFYIYPNGVGSKGALVYCYWGIGYDELNGIASKYNGLNLTVDKVTITGTISAYKGVAQILLNSADDLIIHKGTLDPVSSIEITAPSGVEVLATRTLALGVNVLPLTSLQDVVWSSSNELIATVDTNGVITGISEGKVTITATAKDSSNVKGTKEITVLPAPTYSETTITSNTAKSGKYTPDGNMNSYLNIIGDDSHELNVIFTRNDSHNAATFNNSANEIRVYYTADKPAPGNVLTLTLPEGVHFKNIKIELSKNEGLSINGDSALSGLEIDHDLSNESNVLTIQVAVFTQISTSKAIWIKSITVIYE